MKKQLKKKIYKSYRKLINEKNEFVILEFKRNNLVKNTDEKTLEYLSQNKKNINKDIRFVNCYLTTLGIDSTAIETFINLANISLLKTQEKEVCETLKDSVTKLKNKKALEKLIKNGSDIKDSLLILNPYQYENNEKYTNLLNKYNIKTKVCYSELLSTDEAMLLNLDKIAYYESYKVNDIEDYDNMFNINLDYKLDIKGDLGFLFYL